MERNAQGNLRGKKAKMRERKGWARKQEGRKRIIKWNMGKNKSGRTREGEAKQEDEHEGESV